MPSASRLFSSLLPSSPSLYRFSHPHCSLANRLPPLPQRLLVKLFFSSLSCLTATDVIGEYNVMRGRRQYNSKLHLSTFDRNVPFIRIPLMPTSPCSSYPFQHCRQEEGMTMVFCSSPTPLSILSLITINIINMGQSEFLTHTRPSLVLCCIRA